MKTKLACILTAALALSSAACFKHSYTTGSGGNTSGSPQYSSWHAHWLWGIIGEENVDVKHVCSSGNATVKDSQSFLNGVVGALVGVVYFPTTVEVYCDAGSRTAQVTLTPEQLRRIGEREELMKIARDVSPEQGEELARAREMAHSHGE